MGYRSEIALLFNAKGLEKLKEKIKEIPSEEERSIVHSFWNEETGERFSDGSILFTKDYLKWYIDYSEVQVVYDTFNGIEEEDYRFVRIGEDTADIEILGLLGIWEQCPEDVPVIEVSTTIVFD